MRILITNDDGINAPGLAHLTQIARDFAATRGVTPEIWVIAPLGEQSGVAHCISYTRPVHVQAFDKHRYGIDGTPADCVIAALHDIMPERPDLVLSGVNRGNNAGENALYSGTLGAAMEAALQGVPAVAMSQFLGPKTHDLPDPFEAAATHGAATLAALYDVMLANGACGDHPDYRLFYNVNFPPCPAAEVKGISVARQGMRPGGGFQFSPQNAPNGRRFLWASVPIQSVNSGAKTDVTANVDGYISITPMRADLTAHDMLDRMGAALDRHITADAPE